jgi:hypothetical protein
MSVTTAQIGALQTLALRVISDPQFRKKFVTDPEKAVDDSGLKFDADTKSAIVANATQAAKLTSNMDNVHAAFFFFYHGGS